MHAPNMIDTSREIIREQKRERENCIKLLQRQPCSTSFGCNVSKILMQMWFWFFHFTFFCLYRIDVHLAPLVFCSVIEHGSEDEWNFVWNIVKSTDPGFEDIDKLIEYLKMFDALGCSKQTHIIKVRSRIQFEAFNFYSSIYMQYKSVHTTKKTDEGLSLSIWRELWTS